MAEPQLIASRYQLGDLIGQGGMGYVYRGLDTQTNLPVAIKVLRPEVVVQDPGFLERFDREAEALRKLNHPNIVKIHALIEENDQHYIVLEYVGGGSLADLLNEEKRLPVERILNIALDLADALTRAHRLHIIHRDIKPANIMLAEDGTPRLSDFGHAQLGDHSRVTESGSIIGTYAYLSPEICMGEEVDPRTDIWSFGVMLYEMIAGRRPFQENQPAAILTAILAKPIPDLLQFRPDCPISLLGLIYWMLEKNRDKRVPSVRIIGAQLEAILSGSEAPILALGGQQGYSSDLAEHTPPPTPTSSVVAGLDRSFIEKHVTPPPTPAVDMDGPTLPVTPSPLEAATVHDTQPPAVAPPVTPTPTPISEPTPLPHPKTVFSRRQVVGAPRIFISYRREDSIAVTGRIYDRLVAAFGGDYIFKDVDKIPIGANFKAILEEEVSSCDVLLAVIGREWLEVRDQEGHRRIDDPHDFVRIEVGAGLRRPDILVIPVLVNNAQMPGVDNLPLDLTDLAFRNAAVVRNDPDFNRDSIWLIDQIRHDFDIVPATKPRRIPWRGLLVAAALLLMLALAVLLVPGLLRSNPAADATPSAAAVSPVKAGEYMVLVAQPERLGGQERDVQRFIADDLRRNLEDTAEFSPIRIRTYPAVIRSDEAARQAAEASGAAVIVWGNYDDSRVELDVQIGSLSVFPYNSFPREELEKITDVRVRLTNERQQSAAIPVLAVLQALYTADGDPMSVARNSALGRLLTVNDGTLQAGGIAANWTQMIQFFLRNQNSDALAAIDQALVLDPSSAIAYIARALLLQKAGNFDLALDDVYTAQRLGPSGWGSPIFMLGNDALFFQGNSAEARPHYDAFITARPNDPNGYTMRGISDYLSGQYQDAGKDFDRSIELSSIYNFPYFFNVALALRDGRLPVAQELMSTILRLFPDPTAAEVLLQASYGASTPDTKLIPLARAFGHLALGQWRTVVTDVTTAEQTGNILPELYFIEGFAYCNLHDYHAAEAAYTAALNLDPDFTLVYGMRAEVRLHQNNLIGAAADTGVVLSSSQAAELAPFVPLIQSGKLTCENFFTFDFTVLETATPAASLDGSAVPATRATERPSSTPTLTATATSTPTVTPSPTQTSAPVVSATPTPLYQVEPVAANEWMVLVAELEPLAGKADTNITRFIARDLSRRLEEDVPFSRVRVRQTDQVIHSDREARQAGEETGAAVVVWGNYTGDLIELEVHVGSLRSFTFIAIDRPTLERTVNVTMHLTDPRRQSVVTQVLGVLAMLQSADGNAYEVLRTLAINGQLEESRPAHAEIVSSGISAAVQSYLWRSLTDSAAALDDINRAIDLDPGNPLLYISRGSTYLRLRRLDSARRDADSATRRGPDGWTMPLYIRASAAMLESDLDTAINIYSQIIAQRPELWFPLNMRAALYYLKHDYEAAKTDYAQVFTLQPDTNFPYVVSALIALRDGRMADARHYLNTVLTEFPDPNFSARIAAAAFGDDSGIIFVPMFSAVGHFILEQYDQMLEDTQIALAMDDQITDLYALVGFAYCNLGQYADAEAAYTIALDLEPEKPFVYLLRADVRLKQLNLVGALEDTDRVRQLVADTGIGEELIAYVDAGLRLEVGCTNFFEWTPPE